jgi:signal transduction histidine kinase
MSGEPAREHQATTPIPDCPLASALAARLRAARADVTRRWLERISSRVTLEANRVFPTEQLLDHVPILIDGIASYIEDPAQEVSTDVPVIAKAMELGELRHAQGFDAYEIFKEYEILGSVLFSFLGEVVDEIDLRCSRPELLQCAHRAFEAVARIQQATAMQFLKQSHARVRDREDRLRGFNRMVSHELKNRTGAATGAIALLQERWIDEEQRKRFLGMAADNLDAIRDVLTDLASLSRLDEDLRQQRNVRLSEAMAEVKRRLREFAQERGVAVEIEEPLPAIEVNAAAVELCLTNYITNAVKYSDPKRRARWVRIAAHMAPAKGDGRSELIVEVSDNGIGFASDLSTRLFERFFRAHSKDAADVEGTGLGLSIVRETVEELGGRVWARNNPAGGSTFGFAIPAERSTDRNDVSAPARRGREDTGNERIKATEGGTAKASGA